MDFLINKFLFLIATYLIASIPFGLILSKIFAKKDIRQHGSGNIGATNVARILGKKMGAVTLILDGLKGAVMVIIGRFSFGSTDNLSVFLVLIAAISVIGHVYPIYLKFKGGKGVATTIAVLLAINPFIGIAAATTWIMVFSMSRISAIASVSSMIITTLLAVQANSLKEEVLLCVFLSILIIIRHKENLYRLMEGKENKFK